MTYRYIENIHIPYDICIRIYIYIYTYIYIYIYIYIREIHMSLKQASRTVTVDLLVQTTHKTMLMVPFLLAVETASPRNGSG